MVLALVSVAVFLGFGVSVGGSADVGGGGGGRDRCGGGGVVLFVVLMLLSAILLTLNSLRAGFVDFKCLLLFALVLMAVLPGGWCCCRCCCRKRYRNRFHPSHRPEVTTLALKTTFW